MTQGARFALNSCAKSLNAVEWRLFLNTCSKTAYEDGIAIPEVVTNLTSKAEIGNGRRKAEFENWTFGQARQRLDCGDFSTAFGTLKGPTLDILLPTE
jgi:hypothetical protein